MLPNTSLNVTLSAKVAYKVYGILRKELSKVCTWDIFALSSRTWVLPTLLDVGPIMDPVLSRCWEARKWAYYIGGLTVEKFIGIELQRGPGPSSV